MQAKHILFFAVVAVLSVLVAVWTAPMLLGEDPPDPAPALQAPEPPAPPAAALEAQPAPAGTELPRPADATGAVDATLPLSGDAFRQSMVQLRPAIEGCLVGWRAEMPDFSGRILLSVQLAPDGLVSARVEQSPTPSPAALDCLAAPVWSATWPLAPSPVNLSYPFAAPEAAPEAGG